MSSLMPPLQGTAVHGAGPRLLPFYQSNTHARQNKFNSQQRNFLFAGSTTLTSHGRKLENSLRHTHLRPNGKCQAHLENAPESRNAKWMTQRDRTYSVQKRSPLFQDLAQGIWRRMHGGENFSSNGCTALRL